MKFEDIRLGKIYIDNYDGTYYIAYKYSMWEAWLFKACNKDAIIPLAWISPNTNLEDIELANDTVQLLYGFEFKDE